MFKTFVLAGSLAAVLALSGTALAGNSGGGTSKTSSSTISLASQAGGATAIPAYGSSVAFTISTDQTSNPFVNLQCFQNGALVAQGWAGYFSGALGGESFGLYSPQWTGGAADCTATLDMNTNGRWKVLASTSFHVSG